MSIGMACIAGALRATALVLLVTVGSVSASRQLAEGFSGVEVPAFARIDHGGILTGTLVEVRPTAGPAQVEGTAVTVTDGATSLTCDTGCAKKVKIEAPAGFDTVATSGEGGLIKISDHDSEPLTCKAGLIEVPEFRVSVSGSTNVSLGCIHAPKISIVQTGQASAVSLWWTVETDVVDITNTGEGASTHIIGPVKEVNILSSGEKATVTVRDPAAIITGQSVGGRVFHAPGAACNVPLPGDLGSACLELPTDDAGVIRHMGLESWQGVSSQSIGA